MQAVLFDKPPGRFYRQHVLECLSFLQGNSLTNGTGCVRLTNMSPSNSPSDQPAAGRRC